MVNTVISSGSALGVTDAGLATYVNGVHTLASQWDFTVLFFQTSATPGSQQPDEEHGLQATRNLVGRFVMSPQHAKAFAEILRRNVQSYEAQHGEIPLLLPPEGPVPPEEAVQQVVEDVTPEPASDLPTKPPATSPEESSNGA